MENREGLKEELGWLKVLVVLLATLEFSLVNWLVNTVGFVVLRIGAGLFVAVVAWAIVQTRGRAEAILSILKEHIT